MFRVTDDDDDNGGELERKRGRERKKGSNERQMHKGRGKTERARDILERVVSGELGLPFLQDLDDVGLP